MSDALPIEFLSKDEAASSAMRDLRELAEAIALEKSAMWPLMPTVVSPDVTHQTFHELLVRQIELEIQNEELRRTQAELAASQALYVDLYDSAPVGYCTINEKGQILQLNHALAALLDQPRTAMVDQSLTRFIVRDDQDTYYLHQKQLMETGQLQVSELRMVKPDQSIFWTRVKSSVVAGVGGELVTRMVIIDITACKEAEQTLLEWNQMLERRVAERTAELRQSKSRFHLLAQATFEGISISEGGKLIDGNAQLAKMHGYKLTEMLGRPLFDFVAPESHAWVEQHIHNDQEATYEFVGVRRDGTRFPVEVHGRMSSWHGRKTRISALRDLSSSKQAAAKLQSQQIELEHAQRLALVSEVSAGIIHQIGQPLCAMGANLAVAINNVKSCKFQNCGNYEIFQDIEFNMTCLREAVVHLRALAHPEQPQRVKIDFNQLAEEVFRLLRQESERRQITLRIENDHRLPQVLADKVQLSQVILNLARNAFDACADASLEQRIVTITTRAISPDRIELSVRDTGTGIAPEVMPQLFSPFFTTKTEGLGIGLRLSQTIIEAHGGSIKGSNNEDGIGAIFRVILPGQPNEPSEVTSK